MSAKSKSSNTTLRTQSKKHSRKEELPELDNHWFEQADLYDGKKRIRRGRGLQRTPTKVALSLRLPEEVVDYFKTSGPGWQTRISAVLQKWIKSHPKSAT